MNFISLVQNTKFGLFGFDLGGLKHSQLFQQIARVFLGHLYINVVRIVIDLLHVDSFTGIIIINLTVTLIKAIFFIIIFGVALLANNTTNIINAPPPHLQTLLHLLDKVKVLLRSVVHQLGHGPLPLHQVAKVGRHLETK